MNQTGRKLSVSDRTLSRLLRAGIIVLVIGIPLFGVLYFFDQHVSSGPSLADRQVQTAEVTVRQSPNSLGARLALAEAYRQAHRLDDALKQYDQILRLDGGNRGALLGRGAVLMAKGDLNGAAEAYKKITGDKVKAEFAGIDPQLQEAYYYLGSIYARQNRTADAIAQLEAALKIDQTDADAWYLVGTLQLKQGATDKAVSAFRQALLFVPTGWCEPYQQLAVAYQKLGQAPQAEYAGAMLDFCRKKPAEATKRLQALTSGPEQLDSLLGLGMIAESTNSRDEAIGWYRKVLAVDPKNATAISALSRLGVGPGAAAGQSTPAPDGSPSVKTG